MRTDEFDFVLPKTLIAQTPILKRDESRLLVLDKNTKEISHHHFNEIVDFLKKDDVLVLNNTKVLPARIYGVKKDTNANIELLLHKEVKKDIWECMSCPAKRVNLGTEIRFNENLRAICVKVLDDGMREFEFQYNGIFLEILNTLGEMPLPPYITTKLKDNNRYQTIYAKYEGSVAAPTAGLHFTNYLLEKIKAKGIKIVYVTLHVGLGTFKPVTTEDIKDHKMHSEYYEINEDVALILNEAKSKNKNIISVGTTSTRVLESNYNKFGCFKEDKDNTDIFIYPGYKFKAINSLITNFHLPKSTLIMLVCAFAGKEMIMNAYNEAIKKEYRFFSFGDSMFIKE